jgi:hypothetical protein
MPFVGYAACVAFCGVNLWDGDRQVHGLCEGVLVEARVCSALDVYVVGVEPYVDNLLVVRACDGMVVGSLGLTGVCSVPSIAYAWMSDKVGDMC